MKKVLLMLSLSFSTLAGAQNYADSLAEINILSAPVKTPEALHYTATNPSALDYLSDEGKQEFVESLKFNERGVTSFNYTVLASELTYSQIKEVLSLIGFQHLATKIRGARIETELDRLISEQPNELSGMTDHNDYECEKRATCSSRIGAICTSNCYY